MAKPNRKTVRPNSLDPFDDRVDTLFGELELAAKWGRPSILLAVYKSEFVRADTERLLKIKLSQIGIKVVHVSVNENQFDIPLQLIKQPDLEKTVFFVSGLKLGGGRSGRNAYRALNIRREYLVDHKIRAVFWLTEQESAELPFRAPDFWAFRHQVIEFIDTPPILYSMRVDRWETEGDLRVAPGEVDSKIKTQESLLQSLPDSIHERLILLLDLGNLYWLNGELDKGLDVLTDAIGLARTVNSPDLQFRASIGMGVVNSNAGLLPEAASAFERASRIDPQSIIPWLCLSVIYSRLGFSRRSLLAARKASGLNPRSAEAWYALGNLYAERNNLSEAAAAFQVSLTLEKNNPHVWESFGRLCLNAGELASAISAYENFSRLDPQNSEIPRMLSLLYRDIGDIRKACKMAKQAVKKTPCAVRNWLVYGSILEIMERYDEAITAFSQAAAIDSDNPLAALSLANCHKKKGHVEQFHHWSSLASGLVFSSNDYVKACYYAIIGDCYTSVRYLKSSIKKKEVSLSWLQRDPFFEFMRDTQAFQRLLDP